LIREEGDYFRRQPRTDLSKHSYNYEQFYRYTKMFREAKDKDQQVSKKFYKLVKYVQANSDKHEDNLVIKFRDTLGHRADLI